MAGEIASAYKYRAHMIGLACDGFTTPTGRVVIGGLEDAWTHGQQSELSSMGGLREGHPDGVQTHAEDGLHRISPRHVVQRTGVVVALLGVVGGVACLVFGLVVMSV